MICSIQEVFMLNFMCDYTRGCHPQILENLTTTNFEQSVGYGLDPHSKRACKLILDKCGLKDGQVYFLVGGTQTNDTVIDGLLSKVEGVICASSGHISVHEAGAIESSGHKLLTLPSYEGKLKACDLSQYLKDFFNDETSEHMVQPGMVYISQPTEFGTLYSKSELTEIYKICKDYHLPLYVDGARLGYALGASANDVSLEDLASLCDVFYIGGTKVGALFGEAVVVKDPKMLPKFFTLIKQHGALLAKGRILGIQFETLFTDELYFKIGKIAVSLALQIRKAFESKGFRCYVNSPTNQQFFVLPNEALDALQKEVLFELWGPRGEKETAVRLVTDWATSQEDVDKLIAILEKL